MHLTEKLTTLEGLPVSRATVRRLLRAAGVASPRRRRPPLHRRRRARRAQAGLLCQLDGSPDAWFGSAQPVCSLLGAIDDATGTLLAATFRAQEDAAGALTLLRTLGQTVGLPAAVATDQHGIFLRNDAHWTLAEELQGHQDPTQVGPALATLAIAHLVAQSPQAKGRIERLWNTLQDRLVAELRLAGITTLTAGATFLATTFLPAFTAQFAVPPTMAASADPPGPPGLGSGPHLGVPLRAGRGRGQHNPRRGGPPPTPAGARAPQLREGRGRCRPVPRRVVARLHPRPARGHHPRTGGPWAIAGAAAPVTSPVPWLRPSGQTFLLTS